MVLGFSEPVFDQNLYYLGMKYTSATFASAIVNILPAITFIMAILFRLEKIKIKNIHSIAKIVGTIITLGGATLMTLYKGPVMNMFGTNSAHTGTGSSSSSSSGDHNWVLGTLMVSVGNTRETGLLNVDGYYNSLLSFIDKAEEEGFISLSARHIIVSATTTTELVKKLELLFCLHRSGIS